MKSFRSAPRLFVLAILVAGGCARSESPRPASADATAVPAGGFVTDAAEIRVEYGPMEVPSRMAPGARTEIRFEARNAGTQTWPARGDYPLVFGYHWQQRTEQGGWNMVSWDDSNRALLPSDTPPGATAVVTLPVRALPSACAGCRLVIAPLLEMKAWSETALHVVPVDIS